MLSGKLRDFAHLIFSGYAPEQDFDPSHFLAEAVTDHSIHKLQDPSSSYGKKDKAEFVNWLKKFTKRAAIQIINLMESTGSSPSLNVVRYQIIKSSTSTAANYRAACRARSSKEFFAKISIVVEECDETLYWLETLAESNIKIDKNTIETIKPDWERILRIVAKARDSAYRN
jgi:four helix bundle protein